MRVLKRKLTNIKKFDLEIIVSILNIIFKILKSHAERLKCYSGKFKTRKRGNMSLYGSYLKRGVLEFQILENIIL